MSEKNSLLDDADEKEPAVNLEKCGLIDFHLLPQMRNVETDDRCRNDLVSSDIFQNDDEVKRDKDEKPDELCEDAKFLKSDNSEFLCDLSTQVGNPVDSEIELTTAERNASCISDCPSQTLTNADNNCPEGLVKLVSFRRRAFGEDAETEHVESMLPIGLQLSNDALDTCGMDDCSISNSNNSFDTSDGDGGEIDTDGSEPFGSYMVNPDDEELETTEETAQRRRLRLKRLLSFSSSSSSSEEDEDRIMSRSSSKSSSGSSSAKSCRLDQDECVDSSTRKAPKDQWRQVQEIHKRQLGCQTNATSNLNFQRKVGSSLNLAKRLHLFKRYEKHSGCVNALHFNETGTLIASGSDDLQIVIYDWVKQKSFIEFDSGHRSNVFQSKFMPYTGDCHIVSCGRDGQVRLAQLSVTGTCKGTKKLAQHRGAAHKLALIQDSCHVFLSCGEDGVTYQVDLRQEKPIKLYTTKENGSFVALYSINCHPSNTFEHCVGGRDQFIRIYDTRNINKGNNEGGLMKKLCPHNLINTDMKAHITCAVYNYNGTRILGSYNDEDIYLFDSNHSDGADHIHKYTGHRNSATVKGISFYGPNSEFVVSGSDCGNIYLWDVESEKIVNFFHGDDNGVINVLEPHPHLPMMATSGLDNDVKLWMPTSEEPSQMKDLAKVIKKNKKEREMERSEPDLIDSQMLWFLMHRLRRSAAGVTEDNEQTTSENSNASSANDDDDEDEQPVQCSQS